MEHSVEQLHLQDSEAAWCACPAVQQPAYPDVVEVQRVCVELKRRPPLVSAGEVNELRELMGKAAKGEAFVLTGGDCAETFAESTADHLKPKVQTTLQMAVVLTYGAGLPVVRMGRMAGQCAKPRSTDTETCNGMTLESYRGDAANGHEFTRESRTPNPKRLLETYQYSAATLNLIRAFTQGGYADMRRVHEWNKGFVNNPVYACFDTLAQSIDTAMQFMKATGVPAGAMRTVDFCSAHEALLLEYENALTRVDSISEDLYDTSAHFVWIRERTRQLNSAHLEMFSRVKNPIGVKLGLSATAEDVTHPIERFSPEGTPGRPTLISHLGNASVRKILLGSLCAGKAMGKPIMWMYNPMRGNTVKTTNGYKTRHFETVLDEVRTFFKVHEAEGMIPGSIHVELTGDDVTETVGGTETVDEAVLAERYETLVDPRLSHQQSLELAFMVAEMLAKLRPGLQNTDLMDFPEMGS